MDRAYEMCIRDRYMNNYSYVYYNRSGRKCKRFLPKRIRMWFLKNRCINIKHHVFRNEYHSRKRKSRLQF